MTVPLVALPLALQLVINVADTIPTFDVSRSCRAAASETGAAEDRMQTCLQSEQRARDEIAQQWSKVAPAERTRCAQTASVGGSPTYTELITCLEMAQESKRSATPQPLAPKTSGVAHPQPRPVQPPKSPL